MSSRWSGCRNAQWSRRWRCSSLWTRGRHGRRRGKRDAAQPQEEFEGPVLQVMEEQSVDILVLWISGGRHACRRPGAAESGRDSPKTTRSYLSFRSAFVRALRRTRILFHSCSHERLLERLVEVIVDIPVPLIQVDIPEEVISGRCVFEQLV